MSKEEVLCMCFAKHTSCISEVKCEQLYHRDWFPCMKDGIMLLFRNERNSTFEH